jgi:iron complex outermembrane receptor protein
MTVGLSPVRAAPCPICYTQALSHLRKPALLVCFLITFVTLSKAQDTLQTENLLLHEQHGVIYGKSPKVIPMPYGMETNEDISPLPVAYLQAEDFNQGNIQDPMQLLQGRVAGLTIARAGNNPNQALDVRLGYRLAQYLSARPYLYIWGGIEALKRRASPDDDKTLSHAFSFRSLKRQDIYAGRILADV